MLVEEYCDILIFCVASFFMYLIGSCKRPSREPSFIDSKISTKVHTRVK